jgi:ABC-2 type transport system permease protein
MSRNYVVLAVFKRNVKSYFSGILGYLFIVAFVVAAATFTFSAQFFTKNVANLDQLTEWFPILLLFLVPAITMSAWADEKKLGTAELLFTLPASDGEILLGKYLAVLAVYTVALGFSVTQLFVLSYIGNPDWGLIFSTYFGYWLAGAALVSAGMFASVLTSSATVAFVLGAAICAVPVFIERIMPFGKDFFLTLSVPERLTDFGTGIVPLSGLLYFGSLTAFMLYLNLVAISRRHWGADRQANMGWQYGFRVLSIVLTLVSLNYLASHATLRADLTSEKLFTLSDATSDLLDGLEKERPVTIQVFISTDVPRVYAPVQRQLRGLLRQYDQLGGSLIDVRIVDVEPASKEAEQAETLGILPVSVSAERDGRQTRESVYLGARISSSFDAVTVPFFGANLTIEYELTRSIRTVTNEKRLKIGILKTDAPLFSDRQGYQQIVSELRQSYEVEEVSADTPIDDDAYKVLVAVLPSSLTDPQMHNLVEYVTTGKPVLIFADPYPLTMPTNAPKTTKPRQQGGMMGMQMPPPTPKADAGKATRLINTLDIAWNYDEVVWDNFSPHAVFEGYPSEFVFISPDSGTPLAFNKDSKITSGLQEMFVAYAGTISPRAGSKVKFEPLLKTGPGSGLLGWDDFISEESLRFAMMGAPPRPMAEPDRKLDKYAHIVAAHITSDEVRRRLNVVFVADVDMISDFFFNLRNQTDQYENYPVFDNVTFILNAVDVLAGETKFIALRNRRTNTHTLKAVESQIAKFTKERTKTREKATKDAKDQLKKAEKNLKEEADRIRENDNLDELDKDRRLQLFAAAEVRRLAVAKANIDSAKERAVEKSKRKAKRQVRDTESWFRAAAILIPPIPAVLLGLIVLLMKLANERRNISADRLVSR